VWERIGRAPELVFDQSEVLESLGLRGALTQALIERQRLLVCLNCFVVSALEIERNADVVLRPSLIVELAALCIKSGYGYFLTSATIGDYTTTATPIIMGTSGLINFCGPDDGVIRQELTPTITLAAGLARTECADPAKYTPIQ